MSNQPAPPSIHAPASGGTELAPAASLGEVAPGGQGPAQEGGATVSAVVPASGLPPVSTPGTPATTPVATPVTPVGTSTGVPRTGPPGELARTGLDTTPLVLLALVLVLLGVLLARSAALRPTP